MIPPVVRVVWPRAHRVIRSIYPPIDLFEDIADPADWEALASAEAKTNPRLSESLGKIDLVPIARRVSGPGASWVMAPFTHISTDRPSRFSDGRYGVYHAGNSLEVALAETIHHHERFMARTDEAPGWTAQFRVMVGVVDARLHDLRDAADFAACLDPDDYTASQALARRLRGDGSDGLVYPSVRYAGGQCAAIFWPDVVAIPVQGDHFAYHWDGVRVDRVHNLTTRQVFGVT